jgi:predicted nucleic acid-binding protein
MIVLDTNVLSEALHPSPSDAVLRWLAGLEPLTVFTTSITLAEVLYGIERLPAGRRRARLSAAIEKVFDDEFKGRILPFDEESARIFPKIVAGRQALGRPISQSDAMIAAIARSRRAAVATRNTNDFEHCSVRTINPWTE